MRSNLSGGGFYNSEPRNYGRGFGRGSPRPYQSSQPLPSPQPSRKGDLFVEAGKLAVEYLVSNGLLSSDVISGRLVATTRPRAASPDRVSTTRMSPSDKEKSFSITYSRERKSGGDSRNNSSDLSRENGKVVSVPETTSPSEATKAGYDKAIEDCSKEEISELVSKDDKHSDGQRETEIGHTYVDLESSVAVQHQDKDGEQLPKLADDVKEENKDITRDDDKEGQDKTDESPVQPSENNNDSSTKENTHVMNIHSFLTDKIRNCEPPVISKDMNEVPSSNFTGNAQSDHSFRSADALGPERAVNQRESVESLSFSEGFSLEHESIKLPGSEIYSSDAKGRGEKRALEDECPIEGVKKPKQWLSVAQSDDYSQLSFLRDNKPISVGNRDVGFPGVSVNQDSFTNISLPLKGGDESGMDHGDEKQLFSSSYKICDLNLMEASDVHENPAVSTMLYPSLSTPKKELRIDVDLSMNDNCHFTSGFNDTGYARKDVEIIDLDSPTIMAEGKTSKFSTKNDETGSTSVENISDNPQHPSDNPDGPDGYGLMISELLGNDAPNCSTVQPDINSLHNDMGLHHEEVMFSEDDPIYMSLGEIPLTGLLRAWEQPTQERNPFEQ